MLHSTPLTACMVIFATIVLALDGLSCQPKLPFDTRIKKLATMWTITSEVVSSCSKCKAYYIPFSLNRGIIIMYDLTIAVMSRRSLSNQAHQHYSAVRNQRPIRSIRRRKLFYTRKVNFAFFCQSMSSLKQFIAIHSQSHIIAGRMYQEPGGWGWGVAVKNF